MILPPMPANEEKRLEELYRMTVFDSQPEEEFDEIVEVISRICNAPISAITLIDRDKQWLKAKKGLDIAFTERLTSFCTHTILNNTILEIPDARIDERFAQNPMGVEEPKIRFYAGVPLITSNGYKIGSLCVVDMTPKKLNEDQIFAMHVLAKQVVKIFEIRTHTLEIEEKNALVESQKKQVEDLSAIQSKIITIVAHDVRSPLTSLKKVLELKKAGDISLEKMDEFMDIAARQMDGTINLLSNLVDWGGILLNKYAAKFIQVDLYELISIKIKNLNVACLTKQNRLLNLVPKNCWVYADDNMLRFILRNLVNNAIKFTENGVITVSANVEGNFVCIQVTDTGVGMSEEIKNNLFKTDKRMSRKGTNREEGSGLGLILAKEFSEILGTQLMVESELGKGTTISFQLPIGANIN